MDPEVLGQKLHVFNQATPGVRASAVVSTTGVILHSALPPGLDEDRASAMSAALFTIGRRTLESLACGDFRHVLVKSDGGYLLLLPGDEHYLVMLWISGEDDLDGVVHAASEYFSPLLP